MKLILNNFLKSPELDFVRYATYIFCLMAPKKVDIKTWIKFENGHIKKLDFFNIAN